MIKIGFFPAHPAQFWMMKALYDNPPDNVEVQWYIRDKDVTKELIDSFNLPYTLVSKAKIGLTGNAIELFENIFKFLWISKRNKVDIWLSKYGAVNIASWLLRLKNVSFNDDDADIVPLIAYTSYPFANKVLCTKWTRMGKFKKKAISYSAFHELFYLHPNRFTKDLNTVLDCLNIKEIKPYVIIRLSSLEAHHDLKVTGISESLLKDIINLLKSKFQIYISSEKSLPEWLTPLKIKINPKNMHQVLSHANFCIADSQTMIAEAAVLGVPSLRVSSFVKKIGYLDELERRGLCKGVSPAHQDLLKEVYKLSKINTNDIINKKNKLIAETIDPVPFFWKEILKCK